MVKPVAKTDAMLLKMDLELNGKVVVVEAARRDLGRVVNWMSTAKEMG